MDSPASPQPLALESYRTAELSERLAGVISVPQAVRSVVRTTAAVVLAGLLAALVGAWWLDVSLAPAAGLLLVSLALAGGLGLLLGIVRAVHHAARSAEGFLTLSLETTAQVAADAARLRSGQTHLPPGPDLLRSVHRGVVDPIVQTQFRAALGPLGTPLGSGVRRLLRLAVERLAVRAERGDDDAIAETAALSQSVRTQIERATELPDDLQRYLRRAASLVGSIGGVLRPLVVGPLYLALLLATLIGGGLLLVLWRLAAG